MLKHTVIAVFMAVPLLSLPVQAVDYTWAGGTGNWNAVNWTPGPVTGPIVAGNSAIINSGTVNVNVASLNMDLITIGSGATLNTYNFNSVNTYTGFNLELKGGTFAGSGHFVPVPAAPANKYASGILKSVTVSGTAASTIGVSGANGSFNLTGTGAGATTFNVGDVTGSSATDLTVSAPLFNTFGGTSGLTKTGFGTMVLSGANAYTGVTNVNAGTLGIGNNTALGTTAGNTIVASGATAYGTSALSALAEAFNISGTGVGGLGALRFGGGSTTNVTGSVTLGGDSNIGTDGGVTLTMSGGINTAGHTVTLAPTGTAFNINTVGISGSGSVVKSTTASVTFNASNSHTGATTINQGTLTVGATGTLSGTSANLVVNNTNTGAGNNVVLNLSTGSDTTVGSLSGTIATPSSGSNTATINTQSGRTFTVNQTSAGTYAGVIAGAGDFTIGASSSNTLTLTGTNTYTGATNVNAGTLNIASGGSTHASSAVEISNSGSALAVNGTVNGTLLANASTTISGTGTVGGAATVSGNLNPGNSAGLLTFGSSLALANTTATTMEIDGITRGGQYDAIDIATSLAYDGALTLDLGAAFGAGTHTFNLFNFASQSGSFDSISLTGFYSGFMVNDGFGVWSATTNSGDETWSFTQDDGNLSLTVIPEPRAALLGSLGLLILLRRRRSSSNIELPAASCLRSRVANKKSSRVEKTSTACLRSNCLHELQTKKTP
jgi:autotransporter-associated beta strand protein